MRAERKTARRCSARSGDGVSTMKKKKSQSSGWDDAGPKWENDKDEVLDPEEKDEDGELDGDVLDEEIDEEGI